MFQGGWAIGQLWFFWVMPLIGGGVAGIFHRWLSATRS
jgi:aquaporin Z